MAAPAPGALDQLAVVDVPTAAAGPGQVEVRVVAAAVNPADLKVLRGEVAGRMLHKRARPQLAGYDFSGVVEACGDGVTDVAPGAEVYGFLAYASSNRQGSFTERVVVDRASVAIKPAAVTHGDAAAAATPGLTALQSFRDHGRLGSGGRVLVIGAGGGVGSVAIGVARALGAHVTGVCSAYAVDLVRQLGADEVVDRRAKDPRTLEGPFDVVFDAAAAYSYASTRRMLTKAGAYVTTLPSLGLLGGMVMTLASRRRCRVVVVKSLRADLEQLAGWMDGGPRTSGLGPPASGSHIRIAIDARYPVRELGAALARLAKGEVKGRIVVDVADGW